MKRGRRELGRTFGFPALLKTTQYVGLLDECGFEVLLVEDRTPAMAAQPTAAVFDQDLFEYRYAQRWGADEVERQKEPGAVWLEMVQSGSTGYGMFIARRRD